MNASEFTSLQEENHLKVLRLLEANPQLSQRELADALGVSLGKTNYCLKALLGKGFVKMQSFKKSQNKLAYAYLLTATGITEKAGLTVRFLARKVAEFESLTLEIEALKSEVNQAPVESAKAENKASIDVKIDAKKDNLCAQPSILTTNCWLRPSS